MRSRAFYVLNPKRTLHGRLSPSSLSASLSASSLTRRVFQPLSASHYCCGSPRFPPQEWPKHQILTLQRCLSTNSTAYSVKAWLDTSRSLDARVWALTDAPKIHPAEITQGRLADLLTECCKLKSLEGMQLAQEIMDRILVEKRRYRDEEVDVFVPVELWSVILFGWVKIASSNDMALDRMIDLMKTIIGEAKADENHLKKLGMFNADESIPSQPTVNTFNTFLEGLAQASRLIPKSALIAEETIFDMKDYNNRLGWHTKPNTRSYTYVITAHAKNKHPKAGERAIMILRHVQAEHEAEAEAFMKKRGVKYNKENVNTTTPMIVTADSIMYAVTMNAVLNSKSSFNLVFQLLDEAAQAGVADKIHYHLAMSALAKKIEHTEKPPRRLQLAEQAEKLLARSMKCPDHPDVSETKMVNACLNVWSRAFVREMGPRAEKLFKDALSRGMVPDCETFYFLIRAWSKSFKFHGEEALDRVEASLQLQNELAKESENGDIMYPDYQAYSMAILAFTGKGKDSVARAARILDDMMVASRERRLTTESGNPCSPFSALLSVTAGAPKATADSSGAKLWSEDEIDPYEVASRIYQHVTENVTDMDGLVADHHFYAAFFRTLLAHCNPKAVDFETTALRVWEHACEAGHVSRIVWPQALQIPAIKDTVPESEEVRKTERLPRFWWRNVPPGWR